MVSAPAIAADATDSEHPDFDKKLEVSTTSKTRYLEIAGAYRLDVSAGKIPAGDSGVVRIRINNVEDFDLPISHITASCGCTKAELLDTKLPARGHADLVIKIKTPDKARSADFLGQIKLHIDKNKVQHKLLRSVDVMLSFRVDNLLSFRRSLVPVSVGGEMPLKLEVPFICTVQTPVDQLTIETPDALSGLKGQLVRVSDSSANLSLEIDPSEASLQGTFGEITIGDPATEQTSAVTLIIYRQQPVTLSPRTLRFVLSDDDPDRLVAHAIVRLQPTPPAGEKKAGLPLEKQRRRIAAKVKVVHGEAEINGVKLKAKFSNLVGLISRAEFSLSLEQWDSIQNESDDAREMDWTVVTNGTRAAGTTPITVFTKP